MLSWTKRLALAAALAAGLAAVDARAALPRWRAVQNPYRSYNISGINYGSQQWDKQQAKKYSASSSKKTVLRRW